MRHRSRRSKRRSGRNHKSKSRRRFSARGGIAFRS